jgi:hypothetical protein
MLSIFESAFSDPKSGGALLVAFVSVIGSLVLALITSLLNFGRFRRETLWEQRRLACSDIVSHLYASSKVVTDIRDGFAEDAHRYYESDELKRLSRSYFKEIDAANEAFEANYLVLPPAFRRRYEQLEREQMMISYDMLSGPDAYLYPIDANEHARRDLYDLARAELGLMRFGAGWIARWRPTFSQLSLAVRRVPWRILRAWRRRRNPEDFSW